MSIRVERGQLEPEVVSEPIEVTILVGDVTSNSAEKHEQTPNEPTSTHRLEIEENFEKLSE